MEKEQMYVRSLKRTLWCAAYRDPGARFYIDPEYFDPSWMLELNPDGTVKHHLAPRKNVV